MDFDKKRLYNALNVGLFLFIEDEFLFNEKEDETKAQVLIDFARMDTEDRKALLDSIPEGTLGKKELRDYADKADSWIFEINWSNVPLDDAERILNGRPDILALYQAVPETLWGGEYQQIFLRYGIGVVVQDIFTYQHASIKHILKKSGYCLCMTSKHTKAWEKVQCWF